MNPLFRLRDMGQSAWLDYIRRGVITSGGLHRLVDQCAVTGVTSNPHHLDVPLCFFEGTGVQELKPNHLALRIQPEEGINFSFVAKQPGPQVNVQQVSMDFSYRSSFMTPAEAYERLLHDAMDGDRTLFAREDSVERGWTVAQPALESPAALCTYPAGSWGPAEADELIAPRTWHLR